MAKTVEEMLSWENPVFSTYAFWTAVLLLKMFAMSFLTVAQRYRKKAYANPEDTKVGGGEIKSDPDVERVRRAHLNDMENILPYFTAGFLFVLTDPNEQLGMWLVRIFAVFRILHTIVYAIWPIPQPSRSICFFVALICAVWMTIEVSIASSHP